MGALLWTDEERRTSLMQLAQPAVDAMLAAGVTCRAIGTAADGMRVTNECVTRDAAGGFTQTSQRLIFFRVTGERLIFHEKVAACGLLVAKDGSLLAVSQSGGSTPYSLAEIVKHFFAIPVEILVPSVFNLHSIFER